MSSYILSLVKRPPDVVIGKQEAPYLLRWHLFPRNKWFNVYLHKFLRSDDDRALHDHMYDNVSIILKGAYDEVLETHPFPSYTHPPILHLMTVRRCHAGRLVFRKAATPHRILLIEDKPVWTLFICGPRYREWGFHCPNGWRRWQDFLANDYTKGEESFKGKGCS